MLVLRRKEGDAIAIRNDIVVTVQAIKGNLVILGIEAPKNVLILRGELLDSRKPADGTCEPPTPGTEKEHGS